MAFVGSGSNQSGTSGNTISVAYSPTAGNSIVVGFFTHSGNVISGVTPSAAGGSPTFVAYSGNPVSNSNIGSGNYYLYLWTVANCPASVTSFSVSWTTNVTDFGLIIQEYSGRNTSSLIDATGTGSDGSSTTNHSVGTVTTTLTGDDIAVMSGTAGLGITCTGASGGFTLDRNLSTNIELFSFYQTNVSIGSYTATYTTASTTTGLGVLLALAKASSGYSIVSANTANHSFSGTSASITLASACALNDLIILQYQLNSTTGAVTGAFSDTVNGNYTTASPPCAPVFNGVSSSYGVAYVACNAAGTPTINLASGSGYSGGSITVIHVTGFNSTPLLDLNAENSNSNSTFTNSGANNFGNEFAINLPFFSGTTFNATPSGWTAIASTSGGSIAQSMWQTAASAGTVNFTESLNASASWVGFLLGFYNSSTLPLLGQIIM